MNWTFFEKQKNQNRTECQELKMNQTEYDMILKMKAETENQLKNNEHDRHRLIGQQNMLELILSVLGKPIKGKEFVK